MKYIIKAIRDMERWWGFEPLPMDDWSNDEIRTYFRWLMEVETWLRVIWLRQLMILVPCRYG
jgi:hypothetical protein